MLPTDEEVQGGALTTDDQSENVSSDNNSNGSNAKNTYFSLDDSRISNFCTKYIGIFCRSYLLEPACALFTRYLVLNT